MNNINSVEKALKRYILPDKLDGVNKYKHPKTNRLETALKQLTIYKPPPVLIIHLKRFNASGSKINKFVQFDETLNLSKYTSKKEKVIYKLHAVLVHSGHSSRSGHYYSFVKSSAGIWYEMNDESVMQVSLKTVLQQHAYILFYTREFPNTPNMKSPTKSVNNVSQNTSQKQQSANGSLANGETKVQTPSTPLLNGNSKSKLPKVQTPSTPKSSTAKPSTPKPSTPKPSTPKSTTPKLDFETSKNDKTPMEQLRQLLKVNTPSQTSSHDGIHKSSVMEKIAQHLTPKKQAGETIQSTPTAAEKEDQCVVLTKERYAQLKMRSPLPTSPTKLLNKFPASPLTNQSSLKRPKKRDAIPFEPKEHAKTNEQFGEHVDVWDENEAKKQKQQLQQINLTHKRKRTLSRYDYEYDKGKTKKVRKRVSLEEWKSEGREFQQIQNSLLNNTDKR